MRTKRKDLPSPGGRPSGMDGCVIPSASRRGYHAAARGRSLRESAGGFVEGRPPSHRAVVRCQAEGMNARAPTSSRSEPGANGLWVSVTSRHTLARTRRPRGMGRYGASAAGTR